MLAGDEDPIQGQRLQDPLLWEPSGPNWLRKSGWCHLAREWEMTPAWNDDADAPQFYVDNQMRRLRDERTGRDRRSMKRNHAARRLKTGESRPGDAKLAAGFTDTRTDGVMWPVNLKYKTQAGKQIVWLPQEAGRAYVRQVWLNGKGREVAHGCKGYYQAGRQRGREKWHWSVTGVEHDTNMGKDLHIISGQAIDLLGAYEGNEYL